MDRTKADDDRPAPSESALGREDEQRALDHKLDRLAPSRRAVWPKDDRRSSARVARPRGRRPAKRLGDPPALGDGAPMP